MRSSAFWILGVFLVLGGIASVQAQPVVIAHRGHSSVAPENTLAAVRSALELSPRPAYIEIDLHRSKDGVLVVTHDSTTLRTTGEDHVVRLTPYRLLRTLRAGFASRFGETFASEHLPTLQEVLDLVKDTPVGIMIECKQLLLEDDVVPLLRERGELDRHVFASFDELSCYRAKKMAPSLRTLYLTSRLTTDSRLRGEDVQADILGVNLGSDDDEIRSAMAAGETVWVWTVNEPDAIERLVRLGVDGIISDYPERVQRAIQEDNESTGG